ncbi:unnamed protein product [Caenorhabditis sp. 36 PRJEB53466]|nr:unnamed protein product [Caenorhabditis sp. 36 PRJEB53466]
MKRVDDLLLTTCSFFFLLLGSLPSASSDEHVVYWNSTNPTFRNRNPTIEVRMGDLVRFVCPDNEGMGTSGEYLIVYEVSELAKDECSLESDSREVVRCGPEGLADVMLRTQQLSGKRVEHKKRNPVKNVAQLIRQINPIPNGREYQIGQTYYYMTTSSGKLEGMNKQISGLCESQNMRLAMKVMASQAAHPVKPMAPTRRQEDFVTKSSAEMMGGQEDEDSENDSAHLLPRDLEGTTNPKFRRPSQLEQAAASAGVQDQQFYKVVQMAKEGKTGTFENERGEGLNKGSESNGWHPVNVQYVADLMHDAYQNVDASLTYQREPDFEIHEDSDLAVKSLEYSSSAFAISTLPALLLVLAFFLF